MPRRTGDFWYYARTHEGQQYPVLCCLPASADADWTPPALKPDETLPGEQTLIDCNALAEGHPFFALGAFAVSLDGKHLAYSTDVVGDERFTARVLEIETGSHLPDVIPNTLHDVTWSTDGTHLFYTTVDAAWRPDKVWRHSVGSVDASDDVCIFHETDDSFWASVERTTSDRFLVIASGSRVTSESRVLDAADPTAEPRIVIPRRPGVEYHLDHAVIAGEDRWLVLHNDAAENFTLGVGDLSLQSIDELETVIAHDPAVRLTEVHVSRDTVAVNLREAGLPQVRVFPVTQTGLGTGENIGFDEDLFSAHAAPFSDWRQPLVRLTFESWVTPRTVLDYDPRSQQQIVRKRQPVVGYDASRFVQSREWVRARDGVDVPISVLHHRDVPPRDNAPLWLYGYGAYELSMDPRMRVEVVSALERGMVFVVAHVRGGGEMGRHWYDGGKLLRKKNTFNDYVDCARHLIDTGWTSPDRLVAHGGSAGGLLMGAAANQAPELFAGVVANVPFVDALTSILDPDLPLTVIEWDEWGDPLHDPEAYAYMKSYTPYENITSGDYPAIYALTSINDTRVLYVEPAKWVAQLRATTTGSRPILFRCEMSAGHGGASGRYEAWRETADYSAWAIDVTGASHQALHAIGPAPESGPAGA